MDRDELRALAIFCRVCDDLTVTGFGSQFRVASSKTYCVQPNTLTSTRVRDYDLDALRSFLLSFRKLILTKEPAYIYRVISILGRYGSTADRKHLKQIKYELQEVSTSVAGVRIGLGDPPRLIEPEAVTQTLLNGVFFHNDETLADDLAFYQGTSVFAMLPFSHYIVFVYKQALRLSEAIKLRSLISKYN